MTDTTDTTDTADTALIATLSGLAEAAPAHLFDRVAARWCYVEGPVEDAYVAATQSGIVSVVPAASVIGDDGFASAFRHHFGRPLVAASRPPDGVEEALRTGDATGLAFDLTGRTEFERQVLTTTLHIPAGELRPYSWIARQIGRPRAVRAVGTALGHNPVPLLIPCHRVVRADGTVGQYGFGSDMKQRLLEAEGVDLAGVTALARSGSTLVGNQATLRVCMPTCRQLQGTAAGDRRGFGTIDQARSAGFLPCATCRPGGASLAVAG